MNFHRTPPAAMSAPRLQQNPKGSTFVKPPKCPPQRSSFTSKSPRLGTSSRPSHVIRTSFTNNHSRVVADAGKSKELTFQSIEKMVQDNDSLLLGKSLLGACGDMARFLDLGGAKDIHAMEESISIALVSHEDPAQFIIDTLIAVGTVADFRDLDHDFELAVSQLLICSLRRHLDQRFIVGKSGNNIDYRPSCSSNRMPKFVDLEVHQTVSNMNSRPDLIAWDDYDGHDSLLTDEPGAPAKAQTPNSARFSLLDDDTGLAGMSDFAPPLLAPPVDLSGLLIFDDQQALQAYPSPLRSDGEEWGTPNQNTNLELPNGIASTSPRQDCYGTDNGDFEDPTYPIRQRHRQALLKEIATAKNPLQVYAALDVYGLRRFLGRYFERATYGLHLARQLMSSNRLVECALLTAHYLDHDLVEIERELLPRLLETYNMAAVHEYVGEREVVCRNVLHYINHQLSFPPINQGFPMALYPNMTPKQPYSHAPPIRGAGQARTQRELVEIAMSLIMRFNLESEQGAFGYHLDLFIRYCTVVSLLDHATVPVVSGGGKDGSTIGKSDYTLQPNWRFHARIREVIAGHTVLQKMTIHHLLVDLQDSSTAGYFAVKLGMGDFYKYCVHHLQSLKEKPDQSLQPKQRQEAPKPTAPHHGPDDWYRLPPETKVVMVDKLDQLEGMKATINQSKVIGMDSEWMPHSLTPGTHPNDARTALLQLACEFNSTIYLIDTLEFLKDKGNTLPKILGDMFSNPSILKIAFDWKADKVLIESTFPLLSKKYHALDSFVDLRQTWFRFGSDWSQSSDPPLDSNNGFFGVDSARRNVIGPGSSEPGTGPLHPPYLEAWSTVPALPGMRRCTGGLTQMLRRFRGKHLEKAQRCTDWEQRPLTDLQREYAASDAYCLLEIFAVMSLAERIEPMQEFRESLVKPDTHRPVSPDDIDWVTACTH